MDFESLFFMGLDRRLNPLISDAGTGYRIELGASGVKRYADICLGLPDWQWPRDKIPVGDESASVVHAYHFMEHLTGEDAILMLKEIQRVLLPGGVFQFCIPHASAEIADQDLTHKSRWTESSFKMLFNNPYYTPHDHPWRLKVHYLVIAGIVQRNLCLLGQLVKE